MVEIAQVIHKITEFPIELLEDDIMLEEDIGLDSIKKVMMIQELVGSLTEQEKEDLQEKYSFGDILSCSTYKELEEIFSFQERKNTCKQENFSVQVREEEKAVDADGIVKELIGEITGYDAMDIESDMELETELGFDSIKKVTFINHLLEHLSEEDKNALSEKYLIEDILKMQAVAEFENLISEVGSNQKCEQESTRQHTKVELLEEELPISYSQYTFLNSYWAVGTMSLVSRVTVEAELKEDKLKDTWELLLKKHPALRGYFFKEEHASNLGQYHFRLYQGENKEEIPCYDLRGMNKINQDAILEEFSQKVINSKFDIFAFPLHRFYVFRLTDERFELFLANNHLISDGIGNQMILCDFISMYDKNLSGIKEQINQNAEVSRYIEEVNKSFQSPSGNVSLPNKAKRYEFPHRENKSTQEFGNISSLIEYLSKGDTSVLQKIAEKNNVSLYNILVSAYLLALSKLNPEAEYITINLPTSGRTSEFFDLKEMIGCFAQNLSITFDAAEVKGKAFEKVLKYVQEKINVSFLNQIDLRQGYDIGVQMKSQNILKDGKVTDMFADFTRNMLITNVYMSYVGAIPFQSSYRNVNLVDYHAYTGTNKNSIDILLEQFNHKLVFSINYDKDVYEKADIREIFDAIKHELMSFRAYFYESTEEKRRKAATQERKNNSIRSETLENIRAYLEEQLGRDIADSEASLETVYGVSSMEKMRLLVKLTNQYKIEDKVALFQAQTLSEIASLVQENVQIQKVEVVEEKKPHVAPAQRWLLHYFEEPYKWSGFTRFTYLEELDTSALEMAMDALMQNVDVLRMYFKKEAGEYVPCFSEQAEKDIKYYQVPDEIRPDEYERMINNVIKKEVEGLNIETLPLLKMRIFLLGSRKFEFVVIGHHIILDMISDKLLFEKLWMYYADALEGKELPKGNKNTFAQFIEDINTRYESEKETIIAYWKQQLKEFQKTTMPFYNEFGSNIEKVQGSIKKTLGEDVTAKLMKIPQFIKKSSTYEVMLEPIYKAVSLISGRSKVAISHRMHGRLIENCSYINEIGNFAVNYPLFINVGEKNAIQILQEISEEFKKLPLNGVSYDLCAEELGTSYPDNNLTIFRVNYLGRRNKEVVSELFAINGENENQRYGLPNERRISEIEFIFYLVENELMAEIQYSKERCSAERIEQLWDSYVQELNMLIGQVYGKPMKKATEKVEDQHIKAGEPEAPNGALKVAVVTGGSKGIGKAIVEAYLKQGYITIILARNQERITQTVNEFADVYGKEKVKGYSLDITDSFCVNKITEKIITDYGKVDVLVCCAGITLLSMFDKVSPKEWCNVVNTNLFGTFYTLHAFVPFMKKSKNGSIVIIGSDSSYVGYPAMSAYAASKHGLAGLTKSLAQELKGYDININLVCPSLVNTDMSPKALQESALDSRQVADVVLNMTSKEMKVVTGSVIPVNGKKDMYWFTAQQAEQLAMLSKPRW